MTLQKAKKFTPEELREISDGFETKSPQEILKWAFDTFGNDVALANSFGGASGAVLLDMSVKLNPKVRVFYLDTDFLFPETYATIEAVKNKYHIAPTAVKSALTPEQQAKKHGEALWSTDPDKCCDLRKVQPNTKYLSGLSAWITGIRRDQSKSRERIDIVGWAPKFGIVKINPVAHWDKKRVWDYLLKNKVPYNVLLDKGYKSIGCTYCTKAVRASDDERAGRWAGQDKTECGLHT